MKITVYGSRGSAPFFSASNARFGGNTLCIRLDIGSQIVILDCGSGIMRFAEDIAGNAENFRKFDILLSHLHLDHIVGLSMFAPIFDGANDIRIFTKSRNELPLSSQVFGIFKPPYWPVEFEKTNKANLVEISSEPFKLGGGIIVTPFDSEHPDCTTAFRIDAGKSVVYLLDYEIDENSARYNDLIRFCKDADVIIFDSAYLPGNKKNGWGHSTYEQGVVLAEASFCKRMVFAHFSQEYSDETLGAVSITIAGLNSDRCVYSVAYDGMELEI